MKNYLKKFRFEILFLFVFFEVFLYNSKSNLQLIVTIAEYIFITFVLFTNKKTGLIYFFMFTLLAFGGWSYINTELPNNFWGVRLFGFSFNILYSVFVFVFFLIKKKYSIPKSIFYNKFFTFFILYSLILGLYNIIVLNNYVDNFQSDFFTYVPYFIYAYLLSFLDINSLLRMVKYGLFLTVLSMLLSLVFNIKFQYGQYFVLMNSFAFILPFSIFFFKNLYSKTHYLFLLLTVIMLLITLNIFIGGKLIIIFIITFCWIAYINRNKFALVLIIFSGSIFFLPSIFTFFIEYFSIADVDGNLNVISYKFSQIFNAFSLIDLDTIANIPSSMGNFVAEGMTTYSYLMSNKMVLIFGKGFGGAIPDLFGYLSPGAGESGYALQDATRNQFFKMHLPIYEIIIKSGLAGFIFYLIMLFKHFNSKSIFSFISFVLLFTVFFVSKEMFLLTLIFMRISQEEYNIDSKIQDNINVKINKLY